jgi:hypothetical protein
VIYTGALGSRDFVDDDAFDEEDSFSEAHSSFEYGSSADLQGLRNFISIL